LENTFNYAARHFYSVNIIALYVREFRQYVRDYRQR
jgi:hypothetical protein